LMTTDTDTIRVFVPLTIRKRNGRPKILPPDDYRPSQDHTQDPHVLRAIGRAWGWRRRMESGAASTMQDIAAAENLSPRFVSRTMRLAYLSPEALEHLVIRRMAPALSLNDLVALADRPWAEQMGAVSGGGNISSVSTISSSAEGSRQGLINDNEVLCPQGFSAFAGVIYSRLQPIL
jgi:hypothetical protein